MEKLQKKEPEKGKISNYPKCDFASWYKPTGEKCPNCESLLVEKKDKIVCANCDYEKEE